MSQHPKPPPQEPPRERPSHPDKPTAPRRPLVREDGRDVRHKHFTREHDARTFLKRLQDYGKDAALFTTSTDWKPA